MPLSRKYSPIVAPVYGAMNCNWAISEALAEIPAELTRQATDRIRKAVDLGDVNRIKTIAEDFKSKSDAFTPISEHLIQMAEDFDFEGILKLVGELDQ